MGNAAWKVMAVASSVLAGKVAKAATDGTWKAATGSRPPENPAADDVSWKEAAVFALVSGALMGIARMVAQKQAANVYTKTAGHPPAALSGSAKAS